MCLESVIVLGLDVNGLTVCRALGGKGVPIIGISNKSGCLGCYSKYLNSLHIVDFSEKNIIDLLMSNTIFIEGKPLIFPTTDQTVEIISKNSYLLANKFTLPSETTRLMVDLLNKNNFKDIAHENNIKVALGFNFYEGLAVDLNKIPSFPAIIKTSKKLYNKPIGVVLPKAIIANDVEDAKEWIFKYLKYAGECLVEEYIHGDDDSVYFVFVLCDSNGKVILEYCGRKIRQWPLLTGGTASAEPWNDNDLVQRTRIFFEEIGFHGLASMEYKYDKNRCEYYAIEPTVGRIDFQEGLAIGNGYNFPFALYCSLFNLKYISKKKVKKKKWVCFDADYNSISALSNNKITILLWAVWFLKPKNYAVFSLKDINPFLNWVKRRFLNVQ